MKDLLKYIPGFRSNKTWKKVIAAFYYLVAFTALVDGLGMFLLMLGMPFLIFSVSATIKARKNSIPIKSTVLTLVVSLIITSAGFSMIEPADSDGSENNTPVVADSVKLAEAKDVEMVKVTDKIEKKDNPVVKEGPKELDKEVFEKSRDLKVHYIDVGQGDSIFIELPNGQNALIDGGPGSNKNHLIKYLKGLDFETINYLVATHPHEDHIGGLPEVIRTFQIGKVYMPNVTHTTNIFEELLTTIQSKNLSIVKTETGTVLLDEPGLSLKTLAPDPYTAGNNFNDYSIVLRLDFNDNSFMFTGDGETLTEQYLLADNSDDELKVDVLKIGHHGGDTSTTQPFLNKANPKYSVITVGKGNSYGHPTSNVIARLENANTEIYRTDTDGTIIATSDGENITFVKKGNPIEPNAPPTEAKKEVKTETKPATPAPSKDTSSSSGGSSTGAATQTGQGEVYITPTGSKYHKRACGKGNYSATTLENAKSRGLEPCKKCY